MAAKNWRENQSNITVGQPKRSKKAPKTPVEPSEPLRLGPLVKGISLILTLVALFLIGTKVWEVLQPKRMTAVYLLGEEEDFEACLLYTSPSPRDLSTSRMPSSA